VTSRSERAAFLDREEGFWSAQLAIDERGAACCRAKLAGLAEQRTRLLTGQLDEDGTRRRWPVPHEPDGG
jgi:hypothetical protein